MTVIKYGAAKFREELINTEDEKHPIGSWFVWVISIVVPLEFLAMLAWWFYQSATQFDPDGWWKLRSESSVGTAVIQIFGARRRGCHHQHLLGPPPEKE